MEDFAEDVMLCNKGGLRIELVEGARIFNRAFAIITARESARDAVYSLVGADCFRVDLTIGSLCISLDHLGETIVQLESQLLTW